MKMIAKHQALVDEVERRGMPALQNLRLAMQLLSLSAAIDADCAARLRPLRLSEGRFVMLFLLNGRTDGLSPFELADLAGVSRATVTGLLDGLERDDLLSRHPAPDDRRKINVRLSAKGQSTATEVFAMHTGWVTSLFDGLDEADRSTFARILNRIWQNTDTGRETVNQEGQNP
jgi:DNA-binding MarR family transcriptional regulator